MSSLELYLITQLENISLNDYLQFLDKVVKGGVTAVQLRYKKASLNELYQIGLVLRNFLKPLAIPLIINDHLDVAIQLDAEGIHLGQSDISSDLARKILGPKKIIGLSIESVKDLEKTNKVNHLNYVAASAVFPSISKTDCRTIWELEGLKWLVQHSIHPVIGIGGINISNAKDVIQTGVEGIAVISCLHNALDPKQAATLLRQPFCERKKCTNPLPVN